MPQPLTGFLHETIDGASGPCKAYSGLATALRTFNGVNVILMAADRSSLIDAMREINPQIEPNVDAFLPASIIHDRFVKRKDGEL